MSRRDLGRNPREQSRYPTKLQEAQQRLGDAQAGISSGPRNESGVEEQRNSH
jgi:hypothetical protein